MSLQLRNLHDEDIFVFLSSPIKTENHDTEDIVPAKFSKKFEIEDGTTYLELKKSQNGIPYWKGIIPVSDDISINSEGVSYSGKMIPGFFDDSKSIFYDNIYLILGIIGAVIVLLLFVRHKK